MKHLTLIATILLSGCVQPAVSAYERDAMISAAELQAEHNARVAVYGEQGHRNHAPTGPELKQHRMRREDNGIPTRRMHGAAAEADLLVRQTTDQAFALLSLHGWENDSPNHWVKNGEAIVLRVQDDIVVSATVAK